MDFRVGLWPLVAAAAACGNSGPTNTAGGGGTPGGPSLSISMSDYAFSPQSPTIAAGTTVRWMNAGTVPHTATSDAADSLTWNSGSVGAPGPDPYGGQTPGGSYALTFTKPGTYPYHCEFHGTTNGMTGSITVTP